MRKRKIPMRKCVACGENKAKGDLIRVVRQKDGQVHVDLKGKMNGRGAYICADPNCLEKTKKKKQLARALNIEITDEIFDKLEKIILESNQ